MIMLLNVSLVNVFFITLIAVLWIILGRKRRPNRIHESGEVERFQYLKALRALRDRHEVPTVLLKLFEHDGAGTWPPKSNHDNWPKPLAPYKEIYLELVSLLSSPEPSLDDNINIERRNRYRTYMAKLLTDRVDITEVNKIMQSMESGDFTVFPRDAINGFYCCVAVSRHAYRWATIPVVKVAQLEKTVDFPLELDAPWPYLQRYFGVDADSGNNTANVVHNFNETGERVYKINVGATDLITSSEETFFRMFYDLEVLAMPIYCDMAKAVVSFEDGDKAECLKRLQYINSNLRQLLRIFYDRLKESRISHKVWLSYVQGFQGWGVGRIINGDYVKFDGLSGNHVLVFQALDAFLGIEQYLTDDAMVKYIPANQRALCAVLREYGIRDRFKSQEDQVINDEIMKIVNHLKVFRAAHRARVMSYLQEPAPERLPMTAGKSVLDGSGTQALRDALAPLDKLMLTRLKDTA